MRTYCLTCGIEKGKEFTAYCYLDAKINGVELYEISGLREREHSFWIFSEPPACYGLSPLHVHKEPDYGACSVHGLFRGNRCPTCIEIIKNMAMGQ